MSKETKKLYTLWVDDLSISLLWAMRRDRDISSEQIREIRCFGKIQLLSRLLCSLIFKHENFKGVSKCPYELWRHDHKDSEALFWHVWRDAAAFGQESGSESEPNGLLNGIFREGDQNALCLFLKRQITYEQKRNLGIIRLVNWHRLAHAAGDDSEYRLYLDGKVSAERLKQYADSHEVTVNVFQRVQPAVLSVVRLFYTGALAAYSYVYSLITEKPAQENDGQKVAVFYAQGEDAKRRNDLFWLESSNIPADKVMYYFMDPTKPVTDIRQRGMRARGVTWINLLKGGVKTDGPDARKNAYHQERARHMWSLFTKSFGALFSVLKSMSYQKFWQYERLLWLSGRVAIFESLFISQNISIHFGLFSEDDQNMMAAQVAADHAGVVNTYTHWSNYPEGQMMPSLDTFMAWGPYVPEILDRYEHGIKSIVQAEYPFKYLFERNKESAAQRRDELKARGINFIISFFDNAYFEGGWFDQMDLIEVHRKILKAVMQFEDWGLILKPKKQSTLAGALDHEISGMIDALKEQGRCIVLGHDELPVVASLASDLSIGYGTFNSASVEAALSGGLTVMYDPSRQVSHELYKSAFNRLVFDDMDTLIQKAHEYSLSPEEMPGFGRYGIARGTETEHQVGSYMTKIFNAIAEGGKKDDILSGLDKMTKEELSIKADECAPEQAMGTAV